MREAALRQLLLTVKLVARKVKSVTFAERNGPSLKEQARGDEQPRDQRFGLDFQHPTPSDRLPEPSACLTPSPDRATHADATTESRAPKKLEGHIRELLAAYQNAVDVAEELPVVVWVVWSDKGLGRFLRVPYFRWFLHYFITHHISESLSILNRRLHAIAALSDDPDVNKPSRETLKLFLQSLSPPPYRQLTFIVIIAAVLVVVPLRSFGNVLDVLPLVGAFLRADLTYVARAFTGVELGVTIRATIVLLLGLCVVASLMTSPFGLKRLLFNLYPLTKERVESIAAKDQAAQVTGLYKLEEQVFSDVGLRRPNEGVWDLFFWAFALVLLLLLSLCLALVAFDFATPWDLMLEVNTDSAMTVNVSLPEVHWLFYALPAGASFVAFITLLKRLITAWRGRREPANA